MKTSKASAALWSNANRRTSAERGLGDPRAAMYPVVTIPQLIASIGVNPDAAELLAARSHELSDEQRTAALRALDAAAPKARKTAKAKAKPRVMTPGARRIADIPLRGFNR